jgi:putative transposase
MEESVTEMCGPKGKHDPAAGAVRHGAEDGSVTLGGRRVAVRRPRVRATDGSGEVPCRPTSCSARPSCWARWPWPRCWPSCPPAATGPASSPSAARSRQGGALDVEVGVSRRFVDLPPRRPWPSCWPATCPALDLVALMVDGVHFADHLCVVAMGIGIDGTKHPLAVVEGSTENATWSPTCSSACATGAWT